MAASEGDIDAETDICPFGTDATDCGERCLFFPPPPSPPPPEPPSSPPLPPCTFSHCVPQGSEALAFTRCGDRDHDIQVCSMQDTDVLHPPSDLTQTAAVYATTHYTANYDPSASSGTCDSSGVADVHLIRSESECRDAAFLEGIEFYERTGYDFERPLGCFYAYEEDTGNKLYAAYNSASPSEEANHLAAFFCGRRVSCYSDVIASSKCDAGSAGYGYISYECLCRSGPDVEVRAPAYACYCTLDAAERHSLGYCLAAATEAKAHTLCRGGLFGSRCAVTTSDPTQPFPDATDPQLALSWDGYDPQVGDWGYPLYADPSIDTLHCNTQTWNSALYFGTVTGAAITSESECRAILEWQKGSVFTVFDDERYPTGCIANFYAGAGWNKYNARTGDHDFYCKFPQPPTMPATGYTPIDTYLFLGTTATLLNPETASTVQTTIDTCVLNCRNTPGCAYFIWMHNPIDQTDPNWRTSTLIQSTLRLWKRSALVLRCYLPHGAAPNRPMLPLRRHRLQHQHRHRDAVWMPSRLVHARLPDESAAAAARTAAKRQQPMLLQARRLRPRARAVVRMRRRLRIRFAAAAVSAAGAAAAASAATSALAAANAATLAALSAARRRHQRQQALRRRRLQRVRPYVGRRHHLLQLRDVWQPKSRNAQVFRVHHRRRAVVVQ